MSDTLTWTHSSPSRTICLVACSKVKGEVESSAKDLYKGRTFRLARQWAEQNADAWYILSALYGVLHPDAWIAPYNLALSSKTVIEKQKWARDAAQSLMRREKSEGMIRVVLLAGDDYAGIGDELYCNEHTQYSVERPMRHLRQGEQTQWLRVQLDEKKQSEPCRTCGHSRCDHHYILPSACNHGRTDLLCLDASLPGYGCRCIGFAPSLQTDPFLPANLTGITRLPRIDEIDPGTLRTFDRLAVLLARDEIVIVNEEKLLTFTLAELRAAEDWLYYRHLSVSDNRVQRKRLEQPECCKGVLEEANHVQQ